MKFLLEKGQLENIGKPYEGEEPWEMGVILPEESTSHTLTNLWSDLPKHKEKVQYYLFEILEDISHQYAKWKRATPKQEIDKYFVYMGYHITDKPMTWEECQNLNIAKVLGIPENVSIYHCYSDLTGYLWTNVDIKDGQGHDVYREIINQIPTVGWREDKKYYLCLMFSIEKKS